MDRFGPRRQGPDRGRGRSIMAVAADRRDGAGLRPIVSLFLRETHFHPHLQVFEMRLQDAVAVEVDLSPLGRLEEAVAGLREDLPDTRMRQSLVGLDFPAPEADV